MKKFRASNAADALDKVAAHSGERATFAGWCGKKWVIATPNSIYIVRRSFWYERAWGWIVRKTDFSTPKEGQ